jgi:hypothetical protein
MTCSCARAIDLLDVVRGVERLIELEALLALRKQAG